jgi:hypothetical protein
VTSIAGIVDVMDLVSRLARVRPVFHSEADFQHAFAWELHRLDPSAQVRLEIQVQPKKYLDLLFWRTDINRYTAVELKYLTAFWSGQRDGEAFVLRNHGAQDVNGYHIVNDLARLESFCAGRANRNGVFVLLTNDPSYWRAPSHGRLTNAHAFRVHDGLELSGIRTWGPKTGQGTMKGVEMPIELAGSYSLRWHDYSSLGGSRGQFRFLVVGVGASCGVKPSVPEGF